MIFTDFDIMDKNGNVITIKESTTVSYYGLELIGNGVSDWNRPIQMNAVYNLNKLMKLEDHITSLENDLTIKFDITNSKLAILESTPDLLSTISLALSGTVSTTGNESISGIKTFTDVIQGSISGSSSSAVTVDWSGVSNKPATLVGYGIADAINVSQKGTINGIATLDAAGKVPTTQLPSYVDDVLEFTNLAGFPVTGEMGKIYVAKDTNKTYRWTGSIYIYITSGAVDSVAGRTGVVVLVKDDVGLNNVDNTADVNKPISTSTQNALDAKVSINYNLDKTLSTATASVALDTGILINGGIGGKTIMVNASLSNGIGNVTASCFCMIRCGYDGDNISKTIIAYDEGGTGQVSPDNFTLGISATKTLTIAWITGNATYAINCNK